MAAHSFNIPGGEILTGIGATWFVSYAYYENIDRSHQNWNRVSTARSRLGRYKNSKQYHKTWLQHIIAMNPENLNKNTIGLNALQTIAMAKALLAFLEQHPSQCNKAAPLGTAHTERANTQPKDAQATFSIMTLLHERSRHPLSPRDDAWFNQIAGSNEDTVSIITTDNVIRWKSTQRNDTNNFFDTYKLHAVYDLKNPYSGTRANFFLYVFSKRPAEMIHYGIYHKPLQNRVEYIPRFTLAEKFPEPYSAYLKLIEKQISFGFLPHDTDSYEFGVFPATLFTPNCWNPQRYSKKTQEAQNVCEKIPSVPLCGIVRIIRPRPVNDNLLVPVAFPEEWQYPVNYSGLRMSHQTDCVLQKGDIIFFNRNRILLVYEQPPMEIYASLNCLVLRPYCEYFCSEYLYYYLTDETIRTILHSMEAGSIPRISPAELSKLPVAHQANSHAFYQNKFFEEKFPYSYLKKHNNALSANQHACKPYSGDKAYIFISYCHKDTAEVLPIIQYLLRNGYRVWYDEGIDPGTEWDRNIAEHIVNCGYFIAFITSNYLKSSNCKDELSFARDLEKKRFLVYLEQVDLPDEMKMRLARIQNIHKYTYTNDESFFQKLETAKDLGQYKD